MSRQKTPSSIAWPPFLTSLPATVPEMLTALKVSQRWPAKKLAHGQRMQLTRLLEWASRNVPYYQRSGWAAEKLEEMKRFPGSFWDIWRSVPLLTKPELRAQGPRLNAGTIPKPHMPRGKTITSGSTGVPVEVECTAVTRLIWTVSTVREVLWRRLDVTKRLGAIRYLPKEARMPQGFRDSSWPAPFSKLYRTGPYSIIHVGLPVNILAEWLRRFDPHYLITHPSIAAALLDELGGASGKPPSLEEITFVAEPLSPALIERLDTEWGVRCSEYYSVNEAGYVAFRCGEQGNLHVQSEFMLVEILDDSGKACQTGESGRVVLTPLHNYGTPLLRYEIGDYATAGEPCGCGRTLPVIGQVLGRVRNLVQTPDGRRYWPIELAKFKDIAAIRQFRYVQSGPETIKLELVLNQPLTGEEHDQVVAFARAALDYPFQVEIVPVPEIPRGPTGKYEEFLSLLPGA